MPRGSWDLRVLQSERVLEMMRPPSVMMKMILLKAMKKMKTIKAMKRRSDIMGIKKMRRKKMGMGMIG